MKLFPGPVFFALLLSFTTQILSQQEFTMPAMAQTSSDRDTANPSSPKAGWIWAYQDEPAPKNRFTYFRKVVQLDSVPENAAIKFAADSNAQLWINGVPLRHKVARYHEERITAEVVEAGPFLKPGPNVILVLHHNWGDIITFQRTGNKHAGLFIQGSWIASDETWQCLQAPQFKEHECQIIGVAGNAPRIRYPQIIDLARVPEGDLHSPSFDASAWKNAIKITEGPWPEIPRDVETPGQRESPVFPGSLLAAGILTHTPPLSEDPYSIAAGIRVSECSPDASIEKDVQPLFSNQPGRISGKAGQSLYITLDFFRPVHGYPFLEFSSSSQGVVVDLGYGEITRSLYDNKVHVTPNGWVNTEGVVGKGYADRILTRSGHQSIELPDERTARWLTLHIHFPSDATLEFEKIGITKSQYPITPIGSFECGDETINQIVRLCLIHAEVTMIDAYVDTPGREDGQWLEDDRPRALISDRWFGDQALRRFLIRTTAESQGPDGHFHPFPPSNYPAYPAPLDWSMQWVACLYDDYLWTGETGLIKEFWTPLCRYWEQVLSHVDSQGLWLGSHTLGDIRVGIHPQGSQQSSGVVTPWVFERLNWSISMAKAIGQTDQAGKWEQINRRIAEAFRKFHVIPAQGNVPLHVGDRYALDDPKAERGFSQAAHSISITSGLLNSGEARQVLDYIFPAPEGTPPEGVTRWNNPTYGYRVLRALTDSGLAERAVAHIKERYAAYLPSHPRNRTPLVLQGPLGGPLPEYWVSRDDLKLKDDEINSAQPSDETGSHGWGSVPLLWMHDTLLGVRITEPGGGRIRIAPQGSGLPYISGHTNTPRGLVSVFYDPQVRIMEISIPDQVAAEVALPPEMNPQRVRVIHSAGKAESGSLGMFQIRGAAKYRFEEK